MNIRDMSPDEIMERLLPASVIAERKKNGFVRMSVWVPKEQKRLMEKIAGDLVEKCSRDFPKGRISQ